MKQVYSTSGKIDLKAKTASVFTYLPDLSNIGYKYIKYFNISTKEKLGIVGILVNEGRNYDLTDSDLSICKNMEIDRNPFSLSEESIDFKFSKIPFTDIDNNSSLSFFCWHDDGFDTEILGNYELSCLKELQGKLPFQEDSCITLSTLVLSGERSYAGEPKTGGGGVLTIIGS